MVGGGVTFGLRYMLYPYFPPAALSRQKPYVIGRTSLRSRCLRQSDPLLVFFAR